MAFWCMMSLGGRSVALRVASAADRPRRLVIDEDHPDRIREEWRCARCADWVAGDTVQWAPSGRDIADVPELFAYCEPCGSRSLTREPGAPAGLGRWLSPSRRSGSSLQPAG